MITIYLIMHFKNIYVSAGNACFAVHDLKWNSLHLNGVTITYNYKVPLLYKNILLYNINYYVKRGNWKVNINSRKFVFNLCYIERFNFLNYDWFDSIYDML